MLVWAKSEVLDGLSGVLWSSKEKGVASSWGSQGQLIQGQNLSSSSNDAGTSGGSEAEGSNTELGDSQQAVVVSDSSNDNNGLVVGLFGNVGHDSGKGHWRAVDLGHKEPAKDNLVEGRLGSAWDTMVSFGAPQNSQLML